LLGVDKFSTLMIFFPPTILFSSYSKVSPTQKLLLIKGLSSINISEPGRDDFCKYHSNVRCWNLAFTALCSKFHPTSRSPMIECLLQHQFSLNFILKLQSSVLKIQWSFRTDQGVVDIQCQIQPLQTCVVFLAGHHELRIRNQFFCFSWTRISCKNLLSDSQKCLELLGTFLMG